MRFIRIFSLAVAILLFLTVALRAPAWSDEKSKAKITGLIVSLDPGGSFQIREFRTERRWVVLLHRGIEVEEDDDDKRGRRLSVGDVVEIKGQLLDGRTLLATKIKILARSSAQGPGGYNPQPSAPVNPPNNALVAIVKTLGVGAAVKAFAPGINSFINGLLQNKGAAVQAQTKVVPILSVTIGISSPGSAHIGAAQVSGPPAALAKVEAVAVLEADYQTAFRVKVLVPVDNLKPWEAFRRVPGVGVSAIIDIRI
jgi:hypothetical protein